VFPQEYQRALLELAVEEEKMKKEMKSSSALVQQITAQFSIDSKIDLIQSVLCSLFKKLVEAKDIKSIYLGGKQKQLGVLLQLLVKLG
jgi:hypothetical protein